MSKTKPKSSYKTLPPDTVDPRWLLKALAVTLLVALVFAYLTLCGLFYQGQWQLVLHPSTKITADPARPFEPIHFAVDHSGQPQLTGWFLPAANGSPAAPTILYLHSGDGALSDALPRIESLRALNLAVFAFDYRGFGASAALHPSQQTMQQDAADALAWLTNFRHIPTQQIIPYGVGVGASLATSLAADHSEIPALILESPQSDLEPIVAQDPRTKILPLHLLFQNPFPLAAPLSTLHTPKLLLTNGPAAPAVFRNAANPKTTVEFRTSSISAYTASLSTFLDQYAPPHSPTPLPLMAPAGK